MMIRAAELRDIPRMQELELAAGAVFRDVGMDEIADDDPPSSEELAQAIEAGAVWVAVAETDLAGYLVGKVVDGCAHVEQVSVHPRHARQGLGRRLLDRADVWAREGGLAALTLTTFRDVPWNAPYYERLGFRRLADGELGEGLRSVRAEEAAAGLDRWPRVCMRRPLT